MAEWTTTENTFIRGKGFWISYNPLTDTGSDETALCKNTKNGGTSFLILNGDYRSQFKNFVPKGYRSCLTKYHALVKAGAKKSPWSDDY